MVTQIFIVVVDLNCQQLRCVLLGLIVHLKEEKKVSDVY